MSRRGAGQRVLPLSHMKRIVYSAILSLVFLPTLTFAEVIYGNYDSSSAIPAHTSSEFFITCVPIIESENELGILHITTWDNFSANTNYQLNVFTATSTDCTGTSLTYKGGLSVPSEDRSTLNISATSSHWSLSGIRSLQVELYTGYGPIDSSARIRGTSPNIPFLVITDNTPNLPFGGSVNIPYGNGLYSATTFDTSSCAPISSTSSFPYIESTFILSECLSVLFGWAPVGMNAEITSMNTNILKIWPFGYITRFTSIITGTATGTVPSLTVAFPNHLGALDTSSLGSTTIQFQDAMNTGSTFLSGSMNDDGDTLWGTFMPFWQLFCYGFLTVAIIADLLGIREISYTRNKKKEDEVPTWSRHDRIRL